jgi:putative FmdB family regulatory protein
MPIYEYRCKACGHTLDALQRVSDAPLVECPACSESALKRLISAPAFRLKGSGWYETDFKSDKDKKRNLAETGHTESGGAEKAKSDGDSSSGKDASSKSGSGTPDGAKPATKSERKPDKKSNGSGSEAA